MIKKANGILLILLLFMTLPLSGCGSKPKSTGNVVFYLSSKATQLVQKPYVIKADNRGGQIEELLNRLQSDPGAGDMQRTIPKAVKVKQHALGGYRLDVDFSEEYYDMEAAQEVLVRAAVVKTLIQVKDIAFVSFTVNGEALVNKQGLQVGSMSADSFVENPGRQIHSSQAANMALYFANGEGDKLVKETRMIRYNPNISLEKLVMEQLLEGPKSGEHKPTLLASTKLINISVLNGVCYVNLDGLSAQKNNDITEEVLLYSIVDSLTELDNVDKVQISVDGNASGKLRFVYDLSKMYKRNVSLLEEEKKK